MTAGAKNKSSLLISEVIQQRLQDYARLCLDDIIVNNLASDPLHEIGLDFEKLTVK